MANSFAKCYVEGVLFNDGKSVVITIVVHMKNVMACVMYLVYRYYHFWCSF